MGPLKEILYAEDSANDVELTIEALKGIGIANQIIVARDGAEALVDPQPGPESPVHGPS